MAVKSWLSLVHSHCLHAPLSFGVRLAVHLGSESRRGISILRICLACTTVQCPASQSSNWFRIDVSNPPCTINCICFIILGIGLDLWRNVSCLAVLWIQYALLLCATSTIFSSPSHRVRCNATVKWWHLAYESTFTEQTYLGF